MKADEIKRILINALSSPDHPENQFSKLEEIGVSYSFSNGFTEKVIEKVFLLKVSINHKIEYARYMNLTFLRIALTGAAAIVIMLVSMYIMEGSLTFNALLGLGENYDESMVFLLTQN